MYPHLNTNPSHMVAERGSQEHISERIAKQTVDASLDDPVEEWSLLSVINKNAVDSRRAAWRVITSIEQNEKSKSEEQLASHAREYIAEVEGELQKIRDGILALMDKNLIPLVSTDESKVLYYMMKSDYYRYLAECATYDAKGKATEDTCAAYAKATKIAEKDLAVTALVTDMITRLQTESLDVCMSQVVEQVSEVPKTSSRNRTSHCTAEQILDVPVSERVEQLAEMPKIVSQDRIQQQTLEHIVDTPGPQAVEELAEISKVFSQDRVQQRFGKQTIDPSAISLAERVVEAPDTQTQDMTQHVVNTHVQHVVNTIEVERPKLAKETVQEKINQMTKHIKIPQVQFLNKVDDMLVDVQQQIRPMAQTVQKTTEIPQLQFPDQVVDVPVVVQRQVPSIETVQKTVEVPQTQSIVKELRSKFEVGHTNKVHARNQPDKNRAIRNAHKTVEVPRVQYIDKVADISVDMQRQVSTTQAAQDIEEVEDVSALTQSEVSNISDDDEDQLEQESKKRKLPMPADAVSESRADESDFDRFDDLVVPSPERKTVFISIASGDEAEDGPDKEQEITRSLVQGGESMLVDETDAQAPERELVQAVHAEWARELREMQKKFADDVASDMSDVKNELAHVREMVGVLVRRERSAEHKAEAATRRLDRMEREQTEADDTEHEAKLQEALANQSKAVKVLVDKWFVDKGYGFGKAPTGEIVFIHASAVQGAEVLTIGTDAWMQVVNDDARAQGGTEQRGLGGETRGRLRGTKRMRTKWPNK